MSTNKNGRRRWALAAGVVALLVIPSAMALWATTPSDATLIADAKAHLTQALADLNALSTPTPSSTPTPTPTNSASSTPTPSASPTTPQPVSWASPPLSTPTTITLVSGQTIPKLDSAKDYVLKIVGTYISPNGMSISGGHNVVVDGGDVDTTGVAGADSKAPGGVGRKCVHISGTTGTVWIRGIHCASQSGAFTDGITISAEKATVVLQQISFDSPLLGSYTTNHADCLQSWKGPFLLLVDGFTCTTGYQGTFLNPHDTGSTAPVSTQWEFRNFTVTGLPGAGYLLWRVNPPAAIKCTNVHISGGKGPWNGLAAWPGVTWTP